MSTGIPPVPVRAQLIDAQGRPTRTFLDFLQGLRLAVGGDSATVAPAVQATVLAPVPCLMAAVDALAPVSLSAYAQELQPVAVGAAAHGGVEPVAVCAAETSLEPV